MVGQKSIICGRFNEVEIQVTLVECDIKYLNYIIGCESRMTSICQEPKVKFWQRYMRTFIGFNNRLKPTNQPIKTIWTSKEETNFKK